MTRSTEERISSTVTIPRRFTGPPRSANGGYACGVTAHALTEGAAEASLRTPPPVERPLRAVTDDQRCALYDGEQLISEARHAKVEITPPEPVTIAEAEAATRTFEVAPYRASTPFPGCVTCGPDRAEGDGLRIFPGPVDRPEPLVAWPWTPDDSLDSGDGGVDVPTVWAALDCPSGWAWYYQPGPNPPHVLGRMAAQITRRPACGERTVVGSWALGDANRKRFSASAIWSADGTLLACARATWIALTEEQMEQFAASVS
ncbi:hypothetical protein H0B56_06525 [Haloechinothrix sp. YIM 98757]|uniref:Thioesterase-like superfamily protein n=1 Tax=Haloechinothrix aidingensis TaxID=2752311 RepID=A0A838A9C1_9PSEU|nr:hypothetical protein [Haloechinothrix aidingensis]MBA0125192.1 hypothetical protein [Haloechinothrix aidingensis]